jgi:integrase
MSRLSPGTGSVYPMKSRPGTWCGSTSIAGKKHRVYAPTKREARKKLNRLLANGPAPKPATLTVTRLFDEWLTRDVAGRDCAPATVARHQWAASLWIRELGVRRVSDLSTREVEDALETMSGRLSKASLRQVLSSLKQALSYAERRAEVGRNVAQVAVLPVGADGPGVRRSLTEDEAMKLADVLSEERNGSLFLLSLRVGLRPGEAAALYWEDIDLDTQTVNVTRGRQTQAARSLVLDKKKTTTAKRT